MRLVVFAEHLSDARWAALLVDRVLAEEEKTGWVSEQLALTERVASEEVQATRAGVRLWVDENNQANVEVTYVDIHHLDEVKERQRRRGSFRLPRGKFDGVPGQSASRLGRDVIALASVLSRRDLDAVILVMDMDEDPERREGLAQARQEVEAQSRFAIVLGCPNERMEAWQLAAWQPLSPAEEARLHEVTQRLSFDPCKQAHRLSHKDPAPRSAKQALAELTSEDREREESGLITAPLDRLRQRGEESGLRAFLDEIAERIVPRLASD